MLSRAIGGRRPYSLAARFSAPLPLRDSVRSCPQAPFRRLRCILLVPVDEPLLRRLLVLVCLVMPRHPGADLFKPHVATRDADGTDLPAVSVLLVAPGF